MVLNTILEKGLFTEWILAALEKRFLKQVIMSACSIDPVEMSQLDWGGKSTLILQPPFFKFLSCDLGIGIVTGVGRELIRRSF